jgi:hypothetical protein
MELGSYFLFLQEQIKDIIIFVTPVLWFKAHGSGKDSTCKLDLSLEPV